MRVSLQPAFVLHSRPFNETSALVELFSHLNGRITVIARGARSIRSRFRGLLRPFFPLLASWAGKTDLMSLGTVEHACAPLELTDSALLSGLYLNELLVRLLPRHDPHPLLFSSYQNTLTALQENTFHEPHLRLFEKSLLSELGYGLSLNQDSNGDTIQASNLYVFSPNKGFIPSMARAPNHTVFRGENLLAFARGNFATSEDLRTAKYISRLAIHTLLGGTQMRSRELFRVIAGQKS